MVTHHPTLATPVWLSQLGDWCESCADNSHRDAFWVPYHLQRDGTALYECGSCGHRWSLWWAGGPGATEEAIVSADELVRLGSEAARSLRRPITQAELETLHDQLEKLRVGAALNELWTTGRVTFSLAGGELVARHKDVAA